MHAFIVTLLAISANAVEKDFNCNYRHSDWDLFVCEEQRRLGLVYRSDSNQLVSYPVHPNAMFNGDEQFCYNDTNFCHTTNGKCGPGAKKLNAPKVSIEIYDSGFNTKFDTMWFNGFCNH